MEDIQKAVKTCFTKYAEFSGRAARPEFWWFWLFQFVVLTVLGMVSSALYGLAALAMLLPGLAGGRVTAPARHQQVGLAACCSDSSPSSAGSC